MRSLSTVLNGIPRSLNPGRVSHGPPSTSDTHCYPHHQLLQRSESRPFLSLPSRFPRPTTMALLSHVNRVPIYGSVPPRDVHCTPKSDVETADTSPATKEVDGFSDGGLSAWLTVFGAFLALFCSFGQMNAFGTFQSWYTTHQLRDLHPSTVAWIGSVQLWVFFFSVSETSYPRFAPEAAHQCARLGWFHWPRV